MKTTRSLLLILSAVAAFGSARATTVIPPTFDELVGRAELIFQGTVSDVKSQWTGEGAQRCIVTYVTFTIEDSLKGASGSSYTLRMLGGTVGDQTMEVTDAPKFKAGDRDIVFVENNGTQFIPLVGIMHGRFRVQEDLPTGSEIVVTERGEFVSDVRKLGKEEHVAGGRIASPPLRAADFKGAIKAQLSGRE